MHVALESLVSVAHESACIGHQSRPLWAVQSEQVHGVSSELHVHNWSNCNTFYTMVPYG